MGLKNFIITIKRKGCNMNFFDLSLLQNALRTATPLLLAGLGGLLTMQTGILNIGMDGILLVGAFFGVLGSYLFGSSFIGVIFAIVSGILLGLLFGFFVIELKADEFIVGIAINIFAAGLTVYLLRSIFNVKGAFTSNEIVPLPNIHFKFLENVPILNELLNNHSIFVYISFILVLVIYILLYKTPFGLWIQATGEHEDAVKAVGLNSKKIKYFSSISCGILSALAGVHLSLGYLTLFSENMGAGKGFIALAAIIFGRANPIKVFGAAFLFGYFDALGMRLQSYDIAPQLTQMTPYLVTVIVLFLFTKNTK